MTRNNVRSFLEICLRGLICLALALLIGFAGMTVIAFIQLRNGREAAGLVDAVNRAVQGGVIPFLLSGLDKGLPQELSAAAPIVLLSLSAALVWQAGLYNLGLAGQYALGAAAAILGAAWGLPWYVCLILAALAGALGGAVPGLLKARFHAPEALTGLLMNWVCIYGVQALLKGLNRGVGLMPDLGWMAFLIAAASALLSWGLLRLTVPGFEIRLLGDSDITARYAGLPMGKIVFRALAVSGLMAGVGGGLAFLTGAMRTVPNLKLTLTGPGLYGLAAAVLAGGHPMGAAAMGLLISHLAQGASAMDASLFPPETGEAILAIVLYLASFRMLWSKWRKGEMGK